MSLIWIMNNNGPKMDPWGTPDVTVIQSEEQSSMMTCCSLPIRNEQIQFKRQPRIPICSSLSRSLSCETLSKAFEKSRKMAWVLEFLLMVEDQSLTTWK